MRVSSDLGSNLLNHVVIRVDARASQWPDEGLVTGVLVQRPDLEPPEQALGLRACDSEPTIEGGKTR